MSDSILDAIKSANEERNMEDLPRRLIKLGEEVGELNSAYLQVTSKANAKEKTWDDVREEAIDTAIVALDIALTPFPGDVPIHIVTKIYIVVAKKLAKWLLTKLSKQSTDMT